MVNHDEDVKVLATIIIPDPQKIEPADREKIVDTLKTALDDFQREAPTYDCERVEYAVCDDGVEYFLTVTAMKEEPVTTEGNPEVGIAQDGAGTVLAPRDPNVPEIDGEAHG